MAASHFWWPRITEAIQKKCDNCVPCKMVGKSIKPNIPSTEKKQLPPLSKSNDEIQLDFIGPITEKNRRFYILLSMDRFSKELQIAIRNLQNKNPNQPEGFQPQERRNEQWTVDPFWETDRPQRPQTSTSTDNTPPPGQQQWTPMEEGEIGSGSEEDTSVLEVPAINWAKYVGVKSVRYIKMGHAPRVDAIEQNYWDLGNAVRETEKQFATDLQLLMTETTNEPSLLKTLVCVERQQHDNIPEEYSIYKKKLSSRYGLVFLKTKLSCRKIWEQQLLAFYTKVTQQ